MSPLSPNILLVRRKHKASAASAKERNMTLEDIIAELEADIEERKERPIEEEDYYQDYLNELYW